MAQPSPIHTAYAGMAQDSSRDQLPAQTLWNIVDYIPNLLGAPLRKRGGWVYASSAVSATTAASAYSQHNNIDWVMYGQTDLGGPQLLIIDSPGFAASSISSTSMPGPNLWSVNESTGAITWITAITAMSSTAARGMTVPYKPVLFGKRWFIPLGYTQAWMDSAGNAVTARPMLNNVHNIKVYDGDSIETAQVASANGGAAGARYAAVYKSRVVLANGPRFPRRLFFSTAGTEKMNKWLDPNAWVDMPMHVTGLCPLPTALLVYGWDRAIRIRGSIPPPMSDFVVESLSDEGCPDYRSIAVWNGKAIYANTNGVFLTDAIDTIDLTLTAGMSNYYRSLMANYTNAWRLDATVFRGYYFLSITDENVAAVDTLVCDLARRAWFRFSNFQMHGHTLGTGNSFQKLFAANLTSQVVRLTDIFVPAAANKADGDGTSVLPVIEYPCRRGFYKQGRKWTPTMGLTHWKRLYLSYDMRDAATDNPALQLSYVTTPEDSSYDTITPTLAETSKFTRAGVSFGPSGERGGVLVDALGVKVAQTAPSSDTRIYSLEAEMEAVEGSRVA